MNNFLSSGRIQHNTYFSVTLFRYTSHCQLTFFPLIFFLSIPLIFFLFHSYFSLLSFLPRLDSSSLKIPTIVERKNVSNVTALNFNGTLSLAKCFNDSKIRVKVWITTSDSSLIVDPFAPSGNFPSVSSSLTPSLYLPLPRSHYPSLSLSLFLLFTSLSLSFSFFLFPTSFLFPFC